VPGFIDADEFVVLERGAVPSLPGLLQQYEAHGGLVLHWRLFGHSGHIERPPGGTLASYSACWPHSMAMHLHVKSFVQPRHVLRMGTSHSFQYRNRTVRPVNTAGQPVLGPMLRVGKVSGCARWVMGGWLAVSRGRWWAGGWRTWPLYEFQ